MRQSLFVVVALSVALSAAEVVEAGAAQAPQYERNRIQLFDNIQREVLGYPHYTVFDSVGVQLVDGGVRLVGRVTVPYKKEEIEKRVKEVKGVTRVENRIEVLPASKSDDELRARIADAIYSHRTFEPYAKQPNPPIHIIVERGTVTLEGVVQDESERLLATSLAGSRGALRVVNQLKTASEAAKEFEKL